MTWKTPATHDDADLILRLFELRREAKLRQARDWFGTFFPSSAEDVRAAYVDRETSYLRMIFGYWDMAASFVNHGILHRELFLETTGEVLFLWAKIGDYVPELRRIVGNAGLLAAVETLVAESPDAAERVAGMKEYQKKMKADLAARKG